MNTSDYPHVTDAIKSAGLIDTTFMTDFDRDRGTVVHECCRLIIEGDLDRSSVDPAAAGRVAQFERFMVEVQPVIISAEKPVVSSLNRYQGRLDLLASINGVRAVIDIKGPTRAPWHGLQTAGYARADGIEAALRFSLHLSDERYVLVRHADRDDWPTFLACLSLHNFKLRHRLIEPAVRMEASA